MARKANSKTIDEQELAKARAHFEDYLRKQDLKVTEQRFDILDRVAHINRHFTADDLVDEFRRVTGGPSKSTIYRTLTLLTECGILDEHKFQNTPSSVYELAWARHHHDHLCCLTCGNIIEFYDQELEDAQDRAATLFNFEPLSHSLKIYGVCSVCREANPGGSMPDKRSGRLPMLTGPTMDPVPGAPVE